MFDQGKGPAVPAKKKKKQNNNSNNSKKKILNEAPSKYEKKKKKKKIGKEIKKLLYFAIGTFRSLKISTIYAEIIFKGALDLCQPTKDFLAKHPPICKDN